MNPKMQGYTRYLENQFRWSGSFFAALFGAISNSDEGNRAKLALGFPFEVEAYNTWTRVGRDAFLAECDPDHPLVKGIEAGTHQL